MSNKLNIGLLFGGKSGEYEVSLQSAYNVLQALNKEKYNVYPIGITKEGRWYLYSGDLESIKNDKWHQDSDNLKGDFLLFDDPILNRIDVFLPVLHGTYGEDGTIQGFFEMMDKPYAGCGVLASSACMDKVIAKQLFEANGIPTCKFAVLDTASFFTDKEAAYENTVKKLGLPLFIKPANMGSSVGISKAHNKEEFIAGMEDALRYDHKILIEEFVAGKEVEVAVLGNEQPQASVPGQIAPCKEFYDYDAKYSDDCNSELYIPAKISENAAAAVREYAIKAYTALNCSGLSRIDFFVTEEEHIQLNEINTLPGFTNISMYPRLWEHGGLSYSQLLDKIIELAMMRHQKKCQLRFEK